MQVVNQGIVTEFNRIDEIIADYKQGKMVIMLDDEDRENEGDLLIAAEKVSADDINFMAKFGRGLICLTLSEQRCAQLQLPLMVANKSLNNSPFGTRFTMSVEAASGVTTGISAADRAATIKACIKADATKNDIVQPGHIFPIMAQPGGVLVRAGHTETGCDLARLSGFEQDASVLVEILNEDGSMARRDDLFIFAREHNLKIGTIADLIKYRLENEVTLEQVLSTPWKTKYGMFELKCYRDHITDMVHYALVKGEIKSDDAPFVRVHVENTISDLLFYQNDLTSDSESSGWPLDKSFEFISERENGVIIILANEKNNSDIISVIKNKVSSSHDHLDNVTDISTKNLNQKIQRRIGVGSQILKDLGVTKMNVLSTPMKYSGLSGFNLVVENYIQYKN